MGVFKPFAGYPPDSSNGVVENVTVVIPSSIAFHYTTFR